MKGMKREEGEEKGEDRAADDLARIINEEATKLVACTHCTGKDECCEQCFTVYCGGEACRNLNCKFHAKA